MKTFILGLTITTIFSVSSYGQYKYWEDLNCTQKTEILENCKSDPMKKFYEGKFVPTDDDKTWKLLSEIVSSSDTILPLSFYLFNKISTKSDGALAEMVEEFCAEFLAKHPQYILTYFSKERLLKAKKPVIENYAMFVGYELYLKKKGISDFKYSYQSYKELLDIASKGSKENEEIFKVFWQLVDETIKNMN
jgi:hypothetical protein